MKFDLYTKILLTVIAVCLVVIVARDIRFVGVAHAATDRYDEYGNLMVTIARPTVLSNTKTGDLLPAVRVEVGDGRIRRVIP